MEIKECMSENEKLKPEKVITEKQFGSISRYKNDQKFITFCLSKYTGPHQ